MNWLFQLHTTQPVAQAIGILALVVVMGMTLGSLKVRGIKLGTSGVLFAGIIIGSFSKAVDHATLEFVKEFGLILFVFSIGLQLGPGFTSALRRDGVRLNAIAAGIVVSGTALAMLLAWLLGMDFAGALGMLSGATTNTTSLGAAQQSLAALPGIAEDRLALPALAYAVTYPAAIVGILGTLLLVKRVFRIDAKKEAEIYTSERQRQREVLESPTPVVEHTTLTGLAPANIVDRPIVVTHKGALGKTVRELARDDRVGGLIPLFTGIVLGIVAGTMPIVVPGLAQPLQLGLAGGPLVVALVLGRLGHIGRLVFHVPANTNLAFREFGIALFFAAVGLLAGPQFFASVISVTGLLWLGAGLCVTVLPLLVAGLLARAVLHMNFTVLGGLLAGSLTDPPALAFVNNLAGSDAPSLAYVTVYPLTTLLRILVVQVLVLTLIH